MKLSPPPVSALILNLATSNGEVALFTWDGINKDSWTKTILNNTFIFPQ